MNIIQIAIAIGVGLALAIVLALVWGAIYRKRADAQLADARQAGQRIIDDAKKEATSRVKEADLEAKEKLLQMRSEFDKQAQQRRDEIKVVERRLEQKEENLDKKTVSRSTSGSPRSRVATRPSATARRTSRPKRTS